VRLAGLAAEGHVVVLATHEVGEIDDVLTRAVVLRDGRLIAVVDGRGWRGATRAALARES
jgi:ABC-type uncharacterized transport system ATPase subunit